MAFVSLNNLVVEYDDFRALDGLTLEVEAGAIGLLGPNGAGKSTLLKTLLGFLRPRSGTASVMGYRLPEQALEVRRRMGYMPEREVSSPRVSAVSFLAYCGRMFGMTRPDALERAHEVLNYVGLGEARYRPMQEYSTGMLQRVKLAQALIHDPKLLFLDEPTNGLDPDGRLEMLALIRDIVSRRKVTVLLSSHLLPDVRQVCQYVIMLNRGQVIRHGPLQELIRPLDHRFEVGVRPGEESVLETVFQQAGWGFRRMTGNGHFDVTLPEGADCADLFRLARQSGVQIRHCVPVKTTLESVFIDSLEENEPETAHARV